MITNLSIDDVAKDLEVDNRTVKRWIKEGRMKAKLESKKIGYRVDIPDYEAFLDENPRYKYRHEGSSAMESAARRAACKDILIDLYQMQVQFLLEEHAKAYSDGWKDAAKRFENLIKGNLVGKR